MKNMKRAALIIITALIFLPNIVLANQFKKNDINMQTVKELIREAEKNECTSGYIKSLIDKYEYTQTIAFLCVNNPVNSYPALGTGDRLIDNYRTELFAYELNLVEAEKKFFENNLDDYCNFDKFKDDNENKYIVVFTTATQNVTLASNKLESGEKKVNIGQIFLIILVVCTAAVLIYAIVAFVQKSKKEEIEGVINNKQSEKPKIVDSHYDNNLTYKKNRMNENETTKRLAVVEQMLSEQKKKMDQISNNLLEKDKVYNEAYEEAKVAKDKADKASNQLKKAEQEKARIKKVF